MKQTISIIFCFLIIIGCSFYVSFPFFPSSQQNLVKMEKQIYKFNFLEEKYILDVKSKKEEPKKEEKKSQKEEVKNFYSDKIKILVTDQEKQFINNELEKLEKEITMISKVIYREAGGISDFSHRAAVAWCILNRVNSKDYGDSIEEVITAPYQFAWIDDTPVEEDNYNIAKDVVTRWLFEKQGFENVGRVLPPDYYFFTGDGQYNYFRQTIDSNYYWNWSYDNPYQ